MDKAIILGIYDFVSFHLCKTLLNKGIEVIGVHIDGPDNIPFLDEKRLEIGRNANFSEKSLSEWRECQLEENTHEKTILFISIYDLYVQSKETILLHEAVPSTINQYMKENHHSKIVHMLPIQMVRSNDNEKIDAFLERAKEWAKNSQYFYLPAVYGPWQPPTFAFQQAILAKFQKGVITQTEREWTGDVLFVEDAIETVLDTIEARNPVNSSSYLLESGENDYWRQCANYLQIEENVGSGNHYADLMPSSQQFHKVLVKRRTSIAESITKQLELVEWLEQNNK
ncbi:hypothetical protein [Neobacillus jeddahensis]|uniref:hypothetical protein n=1 Tax=Neobacillus jeddahensis TaxID=1461580 RepID=UPI00058B32A4|nr:hypothetical protein [Neobacillus jeddahensis]